MKKLLSSFVLIITSMMVLASCSKLSEEQKGKLEGIVSRTVEKYQITDAITRLSSSMTATPCRSHES